MAEGSHENRYVRRIMRHPLMRTRSYRTSLTLPGRNLPLAGNVITRPDGALGVLDHSRKPHAWPRYLFMSVAALLALLLIGAKLYGIEGLPRYVALVAVVLGVTFIVVPLYPPGRSLQTGVNLEQDELTALDGEQAPMPLRDVRRLEVVHVIAPTVFEANGDGDKVEALTRACIDDAVREAKEFCESRGRKMDRIDARNQSRQLDLWVERDYVLVAQDRHGRRIIITEPVEGAEDAMMVAAALRNRLPALSDQVTCTFYQDQEQPDHGAAMSAYTWRVRPPSYNLVASLFLLTFVCVTSLWLWDMQLVNMSEARHSFDLIVALTPFGLIAPLWLALGVPDHLTTTLQWENHDSDEPDAAPDEKPAVGRCLAAGIALAALCAFIGLRLVEWSLVTLAGVALWSVCAAGLVVIPLLVRLGLPVITACRHWLMTSLVALPLVVLAGEAGLFSDVLMRLEPGGGGGKTIVPIYFDLLVVAIVGSFLHSMISRAASRATANRVCTAVLVPATVIALYALAFPGLSHLPPTAAVFYLTFNASVGHYLLTRNAR